MASQADTKPETQPQTPEARRLAWLKARRLGVGASDTPALLGASSWAGPVKIYAEKAGLAPLDDGGPEPDYLILGRLSEATNAAMLQRKRPDLVVAMAHEVTVEQAVETGLAATTPAPGFAAFRSSCEVAYQDDEQTIHRSKHWPMLQATFDDLAIGADGPVLVEYKNAHNLGGWDEGPQGVREAYYLQVQHQLAVSGLDRAILSVIVGGSSHHAFEITRDDATIERIVAAAADLARRVAEGDPPEPLGVKADDEAIDLLAGERDSATVELPPEVEALDLELQAAKEAEAEAKKRVKEAQQAITLALGSHEAGALPSGVSYTYKAQSRNPSLSLTPEDWAAVSRAVAEAAEHGVDVGPKLRDKVADTAAKDCSTFRVLRRKAAPKSKGGSK